MKSITIEVPRNGASVQLVLRPGAICGKTVVVASEDVEIRLTGPAQGNVPTARKPNPLDPPIGRSNAPDLDAVLARLRKLNTRTEPAAINSIVAMFQFTSPISKDAAREIVRKFQQRRALTVDANGKLAFL